MLLFSASILEKVEEEFLSYLPDAGDGSYVSAGQVKQRAGWREQGDDDGVWRISKLSSSDWRLGGEGVDSGVVRRQSRPDPPGDGAWYGGGAGHVCTQHTTAS